MKTTVTAVENPPTTGTWIDPILLWVAFLKASSKPETTVYLRQYQVRRLAADFPQTHPFDLTIDDLTGWLGSFDWQPETRRSYRAAIRSFYRWAHVTGRIRTDPSFFLPPVTPPVTVPRPAPEIVFREALMRADSRVRLMLEIAAYTGLRRAEIAQVHTRDIELANDGWSLRVHGKGRRERIVPLLPALAAELKAAPPGYLFPGAIDGHLAPATVGKLMSAALAEGYSAHSLRHRFGTKFHDAEKDLRATQVALGHASVATTQRYTLVRADSLRRMIEAVS